MTKTPVKVASAERPVIRAEITHDLYAIIHRISLPVCKHYCNWQLGNFFRAKFKQIPSFSPSFNALKSAVYQCLMFLNKFMIIFV